MRGWWTSYPLFGTPSYVLTNKLKALKEDLKIWNKEIFGEVGSKKNLLLGELTAMDEKESLCGLSSIEWQ
jgi:hypothetical protein